MHDIQVTPTTPTPAPIPAFAATDSSPDPSFWLPSLAPSGFEVGVGRVDGSFKDPPPSVPVSVGTSLSMVVGTLVLEEAASEVDRVAAVVDSTTLELVVSSDSAVILKKEDDSCVADVFPCCEALPSNNHRKNTLESSSSKSYVCTGHLKLPDPPSVVSG